MWYEIEKRQPIDSTHIRWVMNECKVFARYVTIYSAKVLKIIM